MRGPVVGNNLNATAAVGQDPGADGPPRCPVCGSQFSVLGSQSPNNESLITIPGSCLQVGDLTCDLRTDIARRGKKVIDLTPLPARLLAHLVRNAGKICSRKDILKEVWGYDFKPGSMAFLEVQISRLRAEIDKGFDTRMIETVRGKGYRLRATR